MAPEQIDKILIVVVLYKLSMGESTSLISLNANGLFADVLIYDNSPADFNQVKTDFHSLNLKYIRDLSNPGVSKAYNFAADYAIQSNKSHILLLDQDTYLPQDSLIKYLSAIDRHPEIKLFAPCLMYSDKIYSPCNYYMHRGTHKRIFTHGVNSIKRINFLNSGLLINLQAFKESGGYDENIQLYFSDFEFINRFKIFNKSYYLLDLTCMHELASTDRSDANKAYSRFVFYCRDAKCASKSLVLRFQYFLTIGLRAIKLSIHFKSSAFVKAFYSNFL